MKKKLVISLLVVVLVLTGLAGGVYAKNIHKVERGNKLVGLGLMGAGDDPNFGKTRMHSWFGFTNPDPVNGIDITKVSIIRDDGTVMYEGPYLEISLPPGETELVRQIVTRPMEPHELWGFGLFNYMYKGGEITDPDSWFDMWEAFDQGEGAYTVEIFWQPTTKSPTCPLIGWQHQVWTRDPSPGVYNWGVPDARTESQMVNVTYGRK